MTSPTETADKPERVYAATCDVNALLAAAEVLKRRGRDELAESCGDLALEILREERTYQ